MCKNRNRVLDVAKMIYLTMKKMHKQYWNVMMLKRLILQMLIILSFAQSIFFF